MSGLERVNGGLALDGVPLAAIAERFGTPCYVYSRRMIEDAFRAFDEGLAGAPHTVCYAVKANSNLAVLDILARLGAGFDIGVDKSQAEMRTALAAGIRCFNVESDAEIERLDAVAGSLSKTAPVALRINPDVDARTHPYISTGLAASKFGIPHARALDACRKVAASKHLRVEGIGCHIGSQILDSSPLEAALDRVLELVAALAAEGIALSHVDLGGGFGIRYRDEKPMDYRAYCQKLARRLAPTRLEVLLEPGRAIAGPAGVLLTRVEYLKTNNEHRFAIVDASMSELIRPALYEAWHDIVEAGAPKGERRRYDVAGPVCESSDILGTDRALAVEAGDLLAILGAGAYGMAMASNYNARPRPPEVLVDAGEAREVRARETVDALFALEKRADGSPPR
jgi:diaminopimelate decarboxylase